jgi:hypothetical protein
VRQVRVGILNNQGLGYANESKMIETDEIVHAHDLWLIETRHHPQALDSRMHSGLSQRYHAYSSGVVGHGPGSMSGQGVTVLVHDSLVPKVLGCKVSAPGAVVQGVWLEVQGDIFSLPGPVMVVSVYVHPRTAARSAEEVREAFRVLLEVGLARSAWLH